MDDRILTILLGLVIIFGALRNLFFPLRGMFTNYFWTEPILGFIVNFIVHGSLLAGWVIFLVKGGAFMRREGFDFISFIGLIIIIAGFIIPLFGSILDYSGGIYSWSETPFYTLGFGFTLMLFRIEDERRLLYFHIPLVIIWCMVFLFAGILEVLTIMQ